ncbi:hypothetical protein CRG98_003104 [Punica granatum]|uniref:Uncharacterized protein n=1 Tax=Punica granatum TaxID=22663 RepID=A0A2I0L7E3_PUNGR|nr:hypothetical protein CRG98_003104 [Punica granatum]
MAGGDRVGRGPSAQAQNKGIWPSSTHQDGALDKLKLLGMGLAGAPHAILRLLDSSLPRGDTEPTPSQPTGWMARFWKPIYDTFISVSIRLDTFKPVYRNVS